MAGVKNALLKWTVCVCPKCGRAHKKKCDYSGRLPARIYCPTCERLIKNNAGDLHREAFLSDAVNTSRIVQCV